MVTIYLRQLLKRFYSFSKHSDIVVHACIRDTHGTIGHNIFHDHVIDTIILLWYVSEIACDRQIVLLIIFHWNRVRSCQIIGITINNNNIIFTAQLYMHRWCTGTHIVYNNIFYCFSRDLSCVVVHSLPIKLELIK